jgi:hypothetical protein
MGIDGGPIRGRNSTDMVLPYRENEREVKRKKKSQYIIGNGKKVRFVHVW